jgi:hypothetical protein
MERDLHLSILRNIEEKLDDLSKDISTIKEDHREELSKIKIEQAKCDQRWGLAKSITTFGLGSFSLSALWSYFTNQK